MNIFVTGSTGFVGSNFLELANSLGHNIYALRRSPSSKPRIPLSFTPNWIDSSIDSVNFDFTSVDVLFIWPHIVQMYLMIARKLHLLESVVTT